MSDLNKIVTEPLQEPAGFEIVADLLDRQEVVLAELNVLNDRIEAAIETVTAARKAEMAAEALHNGELSPVGMQRSDVQQDELAAPRKKAA